MDLYSDSRSNGKARGRSLKDRYTRDDIIDMAKRAYLDLAKLNHPDHGGDAVRMAEVNVVYERAIRLLNPRYSDIWR